MATFLYPVCGLSVARLTNGILVSPQRENNTACCVQMDRELSVTTADESLRKSHGMLQSVKQWDPGRSLFPTT